MKHLILIYSIPHVLQIMFLISLMITIRHWAEYGARVQYITLYHNDFIIIWSLRALKAFEEDFNKNNLSFKKTFKMHSQSLYF